MLQEQVANALAPWPALGTHSRVCQGTKHQWKVHPSKYVGIISYVPPLQPRRVHCLATHHIMDLRKALGLEPGQEQLEENVINYEIFAACEEDSTAGHEGPANLHAHHVGTSRTLFCFVLPPTRF